MKNLEHLPELEMEEEKKTQRHREAGMGKNGEPSMEALKNWFLWAGIALGVCLAAVCILGFVASGQNKRDAAVMEIEAGTCMEFMLNRKGTILSVRNGRSRFDQFENESLEEGMILLFDMLAAEGHLEENGAVLITIRPARGSRIDLDKLMERVETLAGDALRRRQSRAVVYAGQLFETDETSGEPGISVSRARFVENLINRNAALKSQDRERLIHLSVSELSAEITEQSYQTSFVIVTAKAVYERKPEAFSTEEETVAGRIQPGPEAGETGEEGGSHEDGSVPEDAETASGGEGVQGERRTPAGETRQQTPDAENVLMEQPEPDSAGSEPAPPAGTGESGEIPATEEEPSEAPASEPAQPETRAAEPARETAPPETPVTEPAPPETPARETAPSDPPATEPALPETPVTEPAPPETPAAEPSPSETPAPETRAPWQVGPGYEPEPESEIITDVMPAFRGDGPGI